MSTSKKLFKLVGAILFHFFVSCITLAILPASETLAQVKAMNEAKLFEVDRIEIIGNSVFDDEELKAIANLGQTGRISLSELQVAKEKISRYYVDRGYSSSGALISQQEVSEGKVTILVVEGRLSQIVFKGLEGLEEKYLISQLPSLSKPLNTEELIQSLAKLEQEPLIANISGEIVRESFGRSILLVEVEERNPIAITFGVNNAYSPSIGSYGGNAKLTHNNLLGFRDRFTVESSQTIEGGLSRFAGSYSFPFNASDGRIKFAYNSADSVLIEEEVEELEIEAESESFLLEVRQPIALGKESDLGLGMRLEHTKSETFVLSDRSFPFTEGLSDGETNLTVLRFFQDYRTRGNNSLFSLYTGFNVGLDIFNPTQTEVGIDGIFWSFNSLLIYAKSLNERRDALFTASLEFQISPDKLLPIEQITGGGLRKVRGYRPNIVVGDNGIIGTVDLQLPLLRNDSFGTVTIGPFVDFGTFWNNDRETTGSSFLASTGLSLQYRAIDLLELRCDYGFPLFELTGYGATETQDNLSFSVLIRRTL